MNLVKNLDMSQISAMLAKYIFRVIKAIILGQRKTIIIRVISRGNHSQKGNINLENIQMHWVILDKKYRYILAFTARVGHYICFVRYSESCQVVYVFYHSSFDVYI